MREFKSAGVRPGQLLFLLPFLLIFAVSGCASSKSGFLSSKKSDEQLRQEQQALLKEEEENALAPKKIISTAFSQVGKGYRYGGTSPETGFDCSGFVKWVYGQYDIALPRSSGDMMGSGAPVDRAKLEPGDLVFFAKRKRISHVGIYTGGGKYIHSPRTGKPVQESDLDDRARGEYFAGARRLLDDSLLQGISDETKQRWIVEARRRIAEEKPQLAALVGDIPPLEETAPTAMAASADQPPAEAAEQPAEKALEISIAALTENSTDTPSIQSEEKPAEATLASAEEKPAETTLASAAEAAPQAETIGAQETKTAGLETKPAPTQAAQTTTAKAAVKTSAKGKKHKVASGDTLYGLARKYGVSAAAIAKANNLKDDKQKSNLKLGQLLIVPAKTN
ncbi:NlpC/P60 family protein [Deltaproteobacteria bacterium OttesenSCG-928-M10]|nr:NlpC/P60 family protein [Deltaproteobacteria bacterium OttesenSCG-928-M10]